MDQAILLPVPQTALKGTNVEVPVSKEVPEHAEEPTDSSLPYKNPSTLALP